MNDVARCTKELTAAVCGSKAYKNFEKAKMQVKENPELINGSISSAEEIMSFRTGRILIRVRRKRKPSSRKQRNSGKILWWMNI